MIATLCLVAAMAAATPSKIHRFQDGDGVWPPEPEYNITRLVAEPSTACTMYLPHSMHAALYMKGESHPCDRHGDKPCDCDLKTLYEALREKMGAYEIRFTALEGDELVALTFCPNDDACCVCRQNEAAERLRRKAEERDAEIRALLDSCACWFEEPKP